MHVAVTTDVAIATDGQAVVGHVMKTGGSLGFTTYQFSGIIDCSTKGL